MTQTALTEVDLETARKWFNVGVKVYMYSEEHEKIREVPDRAELALANYRKEILFIETKTDVMAKKKVINPNQLLFDFDMIEKDLILLGDLHNIKLMLPQLYKTQQEDVLRAEQRFEVGKGYCFTNGTGTGKTFVGLGIVQKVF